MDSIVNVSILNFIDGIGFNHILKQTKI